MAGWKELRRKRRVGEITALVAGAICIFLGIIAELGLWADIVHVSARLDNDFILTLLQIQATIMTITFTVLALLSGIVTDSHYGVSVSSFFLRTYPQIFKQRFTIIIQVLCLCANILLFLFSIKAIIVSLWFVSMVLIVVSITEAYPIFSGRRSYLYKIESYVNEVMEKGEYRELIERFIDEWKCSIGEQTEEEYNRFFTLFMICIERELKEKHSVMLVNSWAEMMAECLFHNDDTRKKYRGIVFVNAYYERLVSWIHNNEQDARKVEGRIHLFDKTARQWLWTLDSLDGETIERKYSWELLSENVVNVACWIGWKEGSTCSEVAAVHSIAWGMGDYLHKQSKKGRDINTEKWAHMISNRMRYSVVTVPSEAKDYYFEVLAITDYYTSLGMIRFGQAKLVIDAVYRIELARAYRIDSEAEVLKLLLIHCYVYYLAFRENERIVGESLQRELQDLISGKEVVESITRYCWALSNSGIRLSKQTEEKMERYIEKSRLWSDIDDKPVNVCKVVRDYFLYFSLLVKRYNTSRKELPLLLDIGKYSSYLCDEERPRIINLFCDINQLFNYSKPSEEDKKKTAEDMYYSFYTIMRDEYKRMKIEEAKKEQEEFEKNKIEPEAQKQIISGVRNTFSNCFSKFEARNYSGRKVKRKFLVSRIIESTGMVGKSIGHVEEQTYLVGFCDWLIKELGQVLFCV